MMIYLPSPSSFLAGISYLLTFVATLRAGSRAKYLFQNNGVLGQIEGPLVTPESSLSSESSQLVWEAAYAFESAVRQLHRNDNDDDNNNLTFETFQIAKMTTLDTQNQAQCYSVHTSRNVQNPLKKSWAISSSPLTGKFQKSLNTLSSRIQSLFHTILFHDEENTEANYYSLSPYSNYYNSTMDLNVNLNSSLEQNMKPINDEGERYTSSLFTKTMMDDKSINKTAAYMKDGYNNDKYNRNKTSNFSFRSLLKPNSSSIQGVAKKRQLRRFLHRDNRKGPKSIQKSPYRTRQNGIKRNRFVSNFWNSFQTNKKPYRRNRPFRKKHQVEQSLDYHYSPETSEQLDFFGYRSKIVQIPLISKDHEISIISGKDVYESKLDDNYDSNNTSTNTITSIVPNPKQTNNADQHIAMEDNHDQNSHIPPYTTKNSKQKVAQIISYAPETFAELRSRFGIKDKDFLQSLQGPYVSFQSNSKGAARSGGLFFFSRDGAYLIKTVKRGEAEKLLEILPLYYRYMKKNCRRSLLTRFCGMYQVRIGQHTSSSSFTKDENNTADYETGTNFKGNKDQEYVFIIMNSVFPAEGSKFISERYDLKGSIVGRECSEEERNKKGKNAVLKDLNLAKELESSRISQSDSSKYGIHIGPSSKASLLSQLRKDLGLLVACGVMDYSLLVGVVNMESEGRSFSSNYNGAQEITNNSTSRGKFKRFRRLISTFSTPLKIATAPPRYLVNQVFSLGEKTLSTILTLPLPYYGAGFSVVDGGELSVIHGTRLGRRAIYYVGVIDFLQPWTARKVLEREVKGIFGYDTKLISCVDPKFYATRFLNFMDTHIS